MNYVCECTGAWHLVSSESEWLILDETKNKLNSKFKYSIINKDCPNEPYWSFPRRQVLAETEHMFLVKR